MVLPYINMNLPWVHVVPHPEPPSHLPPVLSFWVIPVHQPQASCIMHQTWTGDSFHIWYHTCFNAILPNHPTLSLSHRVQKAILSFSRDPGTQQNISFPGTYPSSFSVTLIMTMADCIFQKQPRQCLWVHSPCSNLTMSHKQAESVSPHLGTRLCDHHVE